MVVPGQSPPLSPPAAAVVLASASRYRRELLARLLPSFETLAPDIDESAAPGELPAATAQRLAQLKAATVARDRPEAVVVGSDQVAECGGLTLGKPGSEDTAVTQLLACAGRVMMLHTAVHVTGPRGRPGITHLDQTRLRFRALSGEQIRRYVRRDQPLDCAGGFRFESLGAALFSDVDTRDPSAIQGLPLLWLAGELIDRGIDIL